MSFIPINFWNHGTFLLKTKVILASKLQLQCLNQSKYIKDEKKMLICDACKSSKAIKNIHISLMHFGEIRTFSLQGRQPTVI